MLRTIAAGVSLLALATPALAAPKLDGLTSDHAVIQRGKPIVLTGTAIPGEPVTVVLAGHSAQARAGRDGAFRATLPALPAGGPYDLSVIAPSGTTQVHDLLIGDVFLCSGQSNMELPVERAQDAGSAIHGPADDQLRLVTIAKATAPVAQDRLAQQPVWAAAGPLTTGGFSAACFYMARELRKTANVPIGAIHSSWGGSSISAWMGDDAQRAAGRGAQADLLKLYARDPAAAMRSANATWEAWWREKTGDTPGHEPWQPDAALDWQPVPRIDFYENWGVPALQTYLGMLWYQKTVDLTPEQAKQVAMIAIGPADDADRVWINGKSVGGRGGWDARVYTVPAGTLVAGRNVITINIENAYATGGLPGPADVMKLSFADGSAAPIGEGWRYAVAKKPGGTSPRVPWDDITGAGTIYNAMIAPLGGIGLAGVAWYQGESDTDIPGYADRMKALIAEWRAQFGAPALPFALVSLAGFGKPAIAPGESGWARVRDDQRRVAETDGHTALALAIDLGDPLDIHPGEKHEIGRRLAVAMGSLAYGAAPPPSGPQVASVTRDANGGASVTFKGVTGALHTRSATQATGFELCGAAAGSCRYASASVAGDRVMLAGDGQPVARVRYAWADFPIVNLVDDAALPAGPFEMAVR
ncbi:sialate O-acetylesterase [Sphingomonas sp. NFR15]|uniref:sialate O-acetylesterase n=1 Tax=Sphingomonas sp. NFR15 TaxID=1566282 RepID=UPI00087ED9D5|nr:sialate O-acetylesterase [Sphingomonas sp. NFR15]SDA17141.1 sialate O-acetylesterase [Sphingomonas sp. NFR15]